MNRIATTAVWLLAGMIPLAHADVKVSQDQRGTLGIETAPVASAKVAQTVAASAQVLDPAPLLTLLSDLRAAEAAATTSAAELARAQRLNAADANVSLKVVEAARSQAAADAAKAEGLHAQLLMNWGRGLVGLPAATRADLAEALRTGRASLVRAESVQPLPMSVDLREATVQSLVGQESWKAQVLGPAAQLSAAGVGAAYLLRVPVELQPGRVLTARLQDRGHALQGLKVPSKAIVRWRGMDWVYVEKEPGSFERILIQPTNWLDDGAIVAAGSGDEDTLKAGDTVATVGGAMLLAAENAAPDEAGGDEKADEKAGDTKAADSKDAGAKDAGAKDAAPKDAAAKGATKAEDK
jgi:hypothetical protein